MTIFFDHQTFSLQSYGGISRYYAELISGIKKTKRDEAYLSLLLSDNVHLRETGLEPAFYLSNNSFYKKTQITYRINQAYTIFRLKQKPFNVFHATYYDPYFIPNLRGRPFVVTFLDMIHEKFSTQFPGLNDGGIIARQKQLMAKNADRIIAISESTKRDIVDLLNIDPAKIDVVYLGNSLNSLQLNKIFDQPLEPYLLFVGRRERYKNFEGLLRAAYPVLKKLKLKLICAGGGAFTIDEQLLIREVGLLHLVEQRSINDQTLQVLYQQALAFIFPTFYEGFGIPVLEAFACDCPCIVSNVSSLPEVAGNAAMYIDPTSPDSIVDAIEKLYYDSEKRQSLIQEGRKQLSHFSWQRAVDETINIYQSIM